MIWTKTVTFLKSLVKNWSERKRKRFLEELRASVKEAGQIDRGEMPPGRKFVVTLGKPVEETGQK